MPSVADMLFARDAEDKPRARKPYIISKPRETWSTSEHGRFVEALRLYTRDWKSIEAFIGTKTAIQIRSHAQKFFQKQVKEGNSASVPPPRPKRQPGCSGGDVRKRRFVATEVPSDRSAVAEMSLPLSPHAAAAVAREALQAPPLSVIRNRREPVVVDTSQRAAMGGVRDPGAGSSSEDGANAEIDSGSNSADLPSFVKARAPLELSSESSAGSAGSAGAAAVLADWGRPSSAINSSAAPAHAPAQRAPHIQECTASPEGSAAMQQTANQWREHGTVPSYGALPPHHTAFVGSTGSARSAALPAYPGAELGRGFVPQTPFSAWNQLFGAAQAQQKAMHDTSGNSVVNLTAGGSGGSDDPSGAAGLNSGSGATAGISPQLSAVGKAEELLDTPGVFGVGAQCGTGRQGAGACPQLPPGMDPGADFTLIYAFLGSLFDSSRTDVDHWRVLAEMDPTTRRMAEQCMQNLFANMQMAQWQSAAMMPPLPAQQ